MSPIARKDELQKILQCSSQEAIRATNLLQQSSILEHDHRIVQANSNNQQAFIALRGNHFNGEDFIFEILSKLRVAIVSPNFLTTLSKEEQLLIKEKIIVVKNPNLIQATLAAWYYHNPSQKLKVVGITGTNGKTTVSYILEELYRRDQRKVGIMGTLGIKINGEPCKIINTNNTTPNAIDNQKILNKMVELGVEVVFMEVSSHALNSGRVTHIHYDNILFSNFSPEHLDYHKTMEEYWLAKFKIFELLKNSIKPNKRAIVNLTSLEQYDFINLPQLQQYSEEFSIDYLINYLIDPAKEKTISSYLVDNSNPKPVRYFYYTTKMINKNMMEVDLFQTQIKNKKKITNNKEQSNLIKSIPTNLIGQHNGENITLALIEKNDFKSKENPTLNISISGRMEQVPNKHLIFIDFAHTPQGLKVTLKALKDFNKKIICIFGCGGDRDATKRPLMGSVASEYSDIIIITNDNPRSEAPEAIAKEISTGIGSTHFEIILDRNQAIRRGLTLVDESHLLLIAGKGHEDYQIIGDKKIPFSDRKVVEKYLY